MEELEMNNRILKNENDDLKKKLQVKETEYNILKESYGELFKHNYMLFQENERLKKEYDSLIEELEEEDKDKILGITESSPSFELQAVEH